MNGWDAFKKYFSVWENQTAALFETLLKSPLILEPAGNAMSAMMKSKAAGDKATASMWGSLGLPTKRDQERTLHALNQIESRLLDLEEQLAAARREAREAREARTSKGE